MPDKELATILLKNRSRNPITLRRASSNIEIPLDTYSIIGLKLYKDTKDAFISVDFDNRIIVFDFGDE